MDARGRVSTGLYHPETLNRHARAKLTLQGAWRPRRARHAVTTSLKCRIKPRLVRAVKRGRDSCGARRWDGTRTGKSRISHQLPLFDSLGKHRRCVGRRAHGPWGAGIATRFSVSSEHGIRALRPFRCASGTRNPGRRIQDNNCKLQGIKHQGSAAEILRASHGLLQRATMSIIAPDNITARAARQLFLVCERGGVQIRRSTQNLSSHRQTATLSQHARIVQGRNCARYPFQDLTSLVGAAPAPTWQRWADRVVRFGQSRCGRRMPTAIAEFHPPDLHQRQNGTFGVPPRKIANAG